MNTKKKENIERLFIQWLMTSDIHCEYYNVRDGERRRKKRRMRIKKIDNNGSQKSAGQESGQVFFIVTK